jgi:hypothetical protein
MCVKYLIIKYYICNSCGPELASSTHAHSGFMIICNYFFTFLFFKKYVDKKY